LRFRCDASSLAEELQACERRLRSERIGERLRARDHTIWGPDPTEVADRLGWLTLPTAMRAELETIERVVADARAAGLTRALLLGMGGSSLAPEVFSRVLGTLPGYLRLRVLDSTHPDAVRAGMAEEAPERTLLLVATKSGGTVETFSLFKYCYNLVVDELGRAAAGAHFVAITDPGSGLADTAAQYAFRHTFLGDPTIGGRYSALSVFGLVPAALLGLDLRTLLRRARQAAASAAAERSPLAGDNVAARLGIVLGTAAAAGRDKLTLLCGDELLSFGDWVEQLIAESTGKEGRGIVPVVGEPPAGPREYGADRLFVWLRHGADQATADLAGRLRAADQPLVTLQLDDRYELAAQFFVWEMATAVAGALLGINPFDQPNVEAAKVQARQMVAAYHAAGRLPAEEPALRADGLELYGAVSGSTPAQVLAGFIDAAPAASYLTIQAYVPPTPETDAALQGLRRAVRARTRLATTSGYGPRFLHSTGQLHKGDAGRGRCLQIVTASVPDLPIPDRAGEPAAAISFDVLKQAQALGDRQALVAGGRAVLTIRVSGDSAQALGKLAGGL
jgi:glucose-6-phosphate isomerase